MVRLGRIVITTMIDGPLVAGLHVITADRYHIVWRGPRTKHAATARDHVAGGESIILKNY